MYECPICLHLNHASRLHCATCGTIPANYSVIGKPAKYSHSDLWPSFVEAIRAHGAQSIERWHFSRHNLHTVPLDYYATE